MTRNILVSLRILVPGVIILMFFGYPALNDRWHRQDFDSAAWKDTSFAVVSQDWPPRLTMVDDLLSSRNHLAGLSRREVVVLLGEPDPTPYFPGYSANYLLGPKRSFMRSGFEWLVVEFDDGGMVASAEIRRD